MLKISKFLLLINICLLIIKLGGRGPQSAIPSGAAGTPQTFAQMMVEQMNGLRNEIRVGLSGDRFAGVEFNSDDEDYFDEIFPLETYRQLEEVERRIELENGFKDKLVITLSQSFFQA